METKISGMNAMFLQHIVDADIEMKRISESVERQSAEIVNLNDMKMASDNKSQRDDKGIHDDMRIIKHSVVLQGSSKVGIQDTLAFPICLMCWGGHLFLKGDRRLDLFCFTKLLTVWHKCPSKASLSRRIRVLEENTT